MSGKNSIINLKLDSEGCWPDLEEKIKEGKYVHLSMLDLAFLPDGTEDGKPTLAFRFDLPDGQAVMAECTLAIMEQALSAIKTRLGMLQSNRFDLDVDQGGN